MIVFLRYSRTLSSVDLIVAAFAGSMLSMFCVLLMSPRVQNMSFLVLIGVMIGYICSAVTDFLVTFAEDSDIVNLHNWSMGMLFRHHMGECENDRVCCSRYRAF